MSTNIVYEDGNQLAVACTAPTTPAAGGPVIFGKRPGVALTAEDADGLTTVKFNGVATLSVKGHDGSSNAAIAAGDIIYFTDGDTPKLNVRTAGTRFGYAMEAVTSGATATIKVMIGY